MKRTVKKKRTSHKQLVQALFGMLDNKKVRFEITIPKKSS